MLVLKRLPRRHDDDRPPEPEERVKPVVAIPLWLAVRVYVMYAAVWVALGTLVIAISAVVMIGYGFTALVLWRQA
jgi:hypothetical protein